jgi:hypothetical protein
MANAGSTVAVRVIFKTNRDDVIVAMLTEEKWDEVGAELEHFS